MPTKTKPPRRPVKTQRGVAGKAHQRRRSPRAMVAVACETDFVAKTPTSRADPRELVDHAFEHEPKDVEEPSSVPLDRGSGRLPQGADRQARREHPDPPGPDLPGRRGHGCGLRAPRPAQGCPGGRGHRGRRGDRRRSPQGPLHAHRRLPHAPESLDRGEGISAEAVEREKAIIREGLAASLRGRPGEGSSVGASRNSTPSAS